MATFGPSFASNTVLTGGAPVPAATSETARKALVLQRAFEDFQAGSSCPNSVVTTTVGDAMAYFEVLFRDCDTRARDDDDEDGDDHDDDSDTNDEAW